MDVPSTLTLDPSRVMEGLRVLFVDSSCDERLIFATIFGGYGASVETAKTWSEAAARMTATWPDVVVGAVGAPGGGADESELVKAAISEALSTGRVAPQLVLACAPTVLARAGASANGMTYLPRPLNYDDILRAVAERPAPWRTRGGEWPTRGSQAAPLLDTGAGDGASRHARAADRPRTSKPVARRDAPSDSAAALQPRTGSLLDELAEPARAALLRAATAVQLEPEATLSHAGDIPEHVHLPRGSVVSLLGIVESGKTVEVHHVGSFGVVGLAAALGGPSVHWARVLTPGDALRVPLDRFRALMTEHESLRAAVDRYASMVLADMSLAAVCNRMHTVEAHLATWLLTVGAAAGSSTLHLTHESIAARLGTRRSSISVALEQFQRARVITAARGRVRIRDAAGLREIACECRDAYDALRFGRGPAGTGGPRYSGARTAAT